MKRVALVIGASRADLDTNLLGLWRVAQAFAPLLRAAPEGPRRRRPEPDPALDPHPRRRPGAGPAHLPPVRRAGDPVARREPERRRRV